MKRTLFFITAGIILSLVYVSHAQVQQRPGAVSVKLNRAELKGNALNLDMYMTIERMPVKRYESLMLTITLKGPGRGQTLTLPPVIVNGDNKRKMFERTVAIKGLAVARSGAYAVLKNDPELVQYLAYRRAVAYKSWMNNCQLILTGEIKDYRNNTIQSFTNTFVRQLAVRGAAGVQPNTGTTTSRPPAASTNRPPANSTGRPANATTNRPAGTTNRQPANSTARPAARPPANAATNRQPNATNRQPANSATRRPDATRRPANATTTRPAGTTARPANTTNNNRR
ncbi:MAG: DUF3868 domain-containing protein [Tannerellaceae bacterium]|nr:DUF3868 domain-containing protein [Tannerellaceae bacterium]